jgi:hypothetical protein
MKSDLLKKLYTQLCDFGLNSQEWVIRPVSKSHFLIYHNEDSTFNFMGQIESQSWTRIWLTSI